MLTNTTWPPTKYTRSSSISMTLLQSIEKRLGNGMISSSRIDSPLRQPTRNIFHLRVAADEHSLQRARQLAQTNYSKRGYGLQDAWNGPGLGSVHSVTFLITDQYNQDVATVSLVHDSSSGLPAAALYLDQVTHARTQGRRMAEVVQLAIAEKYASNRTLLAYMFSFIYYYSRKVTYVDDFIIEINPKHAKFYTRLLCFESWGTKKACPRVNNAPAILMRLDLRIADMEIQKDARNQAIGQKRNLYPYFYLLGEDFEVCKKCAQRG